MEQCVVWVHGIGQHQPGYSAGWRQVFNTYLGLPEANFVEVVWDSVFTGAVTPGTRGAATPGTRGAPAAAPVPRLTRQQREAEQEIRSYLRSVLQARADSVSQPAPGTRTRGAAPAAVEWSERWGGVPGMRGGPPDATRGFLPAWLANPDAYIGDFSKYLVSRRVRTAVKEEAKKKLRPLAGTGARIALITHSWGTVVGYEALLDLERELPSLRVTDLITLGSPLWMVKLLLQDRSGRKPAQLDQWVNIHAWGDLVGSWLKPGFAVDGDYEVPSMGNDAHGSYFVTGNELVQKAIVAKAVLSTP